MIVILSPAKTFSKNITRYETKPIFLEDAVLLNKKLRKLSLTKISSSMKISIELAIKVKDDYESFNFNPRSAIYAYDGYAFKGFDVHTLDNKALTYLKDHLIILSGLYGIVRPFDGITPYRLEIKDKTILNLYHYWENKISSYLKNHYSNELIINLSSGEYQKVIDQNIKMINIQFAKFINQKPKINSMEIKHMRGVMARHLIMNPITTSDELKTIQIEGYHYDETYSTEDEFMFILEDAL